MNIIEMKLRVCRIWHQLIVNLGIVTKVCEKPHAVLFSTEEAHCPDVLIILPHVSRSLWMNDYTDPCANTQTLSRVFVFIVLFTVCFSLLQAPRGFLRVQAASRVITARASMFHVCVTGSPTAPEERTRYCAVSFYKHTADKTSENSPHYSLIDIFSLISLFCLSLDKHSPSAVPPSDGNTSAVCPEFTCEDGSCVPFSAVLTHSSLYVHLTTTTKLNYETSFMSLMEDYGKLIKYSFCNMTYTLYQTHHRVMWCVCCCNCVMCVCVAVV